MSAITLADRLNLYGHLQEVEGKGSNPELLAIIKKWHKDAPDDDSVTSWCSILLLEAFSDDYVTTGATIAARSWLKVGTPTDEPIPGDTIVVFKRGNSTWQGHVGVFMGYSKNGKFVRVKGGNQNNKTSTISLPRDRVLGYRNLTPK